MRTHYVTRALAAGHDVTLLGFAYDSSSESPPFDLTVHEVPWSWPPLYRQLQDGEPGWEDAYRILDEEGDEPWFVSASGSTEMAHAIEAVLADGIDVVIFEGTDMARFAFMVPSTIPVVVDFMDVHTRIAQREVARLAPANRERAEHEAGRTLRFERRLADRCAACLVCSEREAETAREVLGFRRVFVVPNGVAPEYFAPADAAAEEFGFLLFTGTMSYPPNVEAAHHFALEILPEVRREVPEAAFHVVGKAPTREVRGLASDGVRIHADVPDVRPYYRRASVVVVPLLQGGGTRIKILEAAACAKAVVTTTMGVEGLDFRPPRELLVADGASGFASAVVELLRSPRQRAALGLAAHRRSRDYHWSAIEPRVRAIVEDVAHAR